MKLEPKITAIILAAGRGKRAGGKIPKQWQKLHRRPVITWSIDRFINHTKISQVVVVYHPDDIHQLNVIPKNVLCVIGGEDRGESVRRGLHALKNEAPDYVMIHDAARPCLSEALLDRCILSTLTHRASAPAIGVTETLWRGQKTVQEVLDRTDVLRAQTPQCFDYQLIVSAHQKFVGDATDDVSVVRAEGHRVAIIPGCYDNIKITESSDFKLAELTLRGATKMRIGNGFDVHKFGPGNCVTLCGVSISHDSTLIGHSDADVGMHAITDAIYGALAKGDIGQHFPHSDPQWKGADSSIFLKHAVNLAHEFGYNIENIDCTIICEFPKISPHTNAMRQALADIMQLDLDRISVKATTSEQLGFTGRGEGIAAAASAALVLT